MNPYIFLINTPSSSLSKRITIPVALLSRLEVLSAVLSIHVAAAQKFPTRDEIMSLVKSPSIRRLSAVV